MKTFFLWRSFEISFLRTTFVPYSCKYHRKNIQFAVCWRVNCWLCLRSCFLRLYLKHWPIEKSLCMYLCYEYPKSCLDGRQNFVNLLANDLKQKYFVSQKKCSGIVFKLNPNDKQITKYTNVERRAPKYGQNTIWNYHCYIPLVDVEMTWHM